MVESKISKFNAKLRKLIIKKTFLFLLVSVISVGKANTIHNEIHFKILFSYFFIFSAKNKNTRIHISEDGLEYHLRRLADYMLPGEHVWWKRDGDWIEFFDGDDQPESHAEGPKLMSFETDDLITSKATVEKSWTKCLTEKVKNDILQIENGNDFIFYPLPNLHYCANKSILSKNSFTR